MKEWYEKYRNATEEEIIIQALEACNRRDCAHCLYQGKGIKCRSHLISDATQALTKERTR